MEKALLKIIMGDELLELLKNVMVQYIEYEVLKRILIDCGFLSGLL